MDSLKSFAENYFFNDLQTLLCTIWFNLKALAEQTFYIFNLDTTALSELHVIICINRATERRVRPERILFASGYNK